MTPEHVFFLRGQGFFFVHDVGGHGQHADILEQGRDGQKDAAEFADSSEVDFDYGKSTQARGLFER